MMYRHTTIQKGCSKWQNFKLGIALSKQFSVYEHGMERVLQDKASNQNNQQYYCYVAPVMADLFYLYNTKLSNFELLSSCVSYLQEKQYRNPVAERLLQDFLAIAKGVGIDVRTVIYKAVS